MWVRQLFLFLFVLFFTVDSLKLNVKDIDVSSFANEIELWTKLNYETESFKDLLNSLKIPTELQNSDWRSFSAEPSIAICTICQGTIKAFMDLRHSGMCEEDIKTKIIKLCVLLNIQTERVCKGIIQSNLPIILYIIDSKPNLTGNTICGVLLESKACPLSDPEFVWNINISDNRNPVMIENKTDEQIRIIHITDLHYDSMYEANGNSDCKEPVCCRKGQNESDTTSLAGYWGDYNSCDTPWHAIIDALTHIKDNHQNADFIYFTGDIIDHGVWETSKERNKENLIKVYNKIHDTLNYTIVYPILGNHEPHPLNQFAPKNVTKDELSTNWLYALIADLWIGYGWLPDSARSTLLQGGYYTVIPKKGFRIIALNSNVCYSYNWWLWYSPIDPDNQLQWLANTLDEAEKKHEFVHILSHIPANTNSCLNTWKREYLKIIDRFSHLIKAIFNGHTHNDEITIYYNSHAEARNVAWNGGSITAYTKLNPNYKMYTVNRSNYAVTDYENWMYDLGSANQNNNAKPMWYKSYSFKTEYDVADLKVTSLSKWLHATARNETLLKKYYKNFYKRAEPSIQTTCDPNCMKQYLCRIIINADTDLCNTILIE